MSQHKILVVDDDAWIRTEICEALSLRGYTPAPASGLVEARAILESQSDICIATVDYHMPQMSGAELINILKTEFARPFAFIMLTGDGTQQSAVDAIRADVFDFIRKPVDGKPLADAVGRAAKSLASHEQSPLQLSAASIAENLDSLKSRIQTRADEQPALAALRRAYSPEGSQKPSRLDLVLHLMRGIKTAIDPQARMLMTHEALEHARKIIQIIDGMFPRLAASAGSDAPGLVDLNLIARQTLPTLDVLARHRQVKFKTHLPATLPMLLADEGGLSRLFSELAVALVDGLGEGDGLTVTAIKDAVNVVLTFRLVAQAPDSAFVDALGGGMPAVVGSPDHLRLSTVRIMASTAAVEMMGGRVVYESHLEDHHSLRLYLSAAGATRSAA